MQHLPEQGEHLPVPCQFRLVLYAPCQVADIMLCAFLVVCAIAVKGLVMVMHDRPHIVRKRGANDPCMPLFLPADIQCGVL